MTTHALSNEQLLDLYYFLRLTRSCDDAILRLYRQGKLVGGAYAGTGNEATAVGSAFALRPQDYLFPMHRDLGAHLVRGQTLEMIFLQQLGRASSLTRGRDGTGHYADPARRIYGNVSHLAAMIPVAAGVALASRMKKENAVVLNYIGDGGSNVGDFHEGLNMAAVMKLPFVLIVENNQFAYSTPVAKQHAAAHIADRAVGYGMPGTTVDGTDILAVYAATQAAVERARAGDGPTLIESVTMRLQGHSASDDASYVPAALLEEWKAKDPVVRFDRELEDAGILTAATRTAIETRIAEGIARAVQVALEAELPDGADALEGVFAP